jgi:hypothetical protein
MQSKPSSSASWAVAAAALSALLSSGSAWADPAVQPTPQTAPSSQGSNTVREVTVTAQAKRAVLQRRVEGFIQGMTSQSYGDQPLRTWREPVCPLVSGIARDQAEFLLGRLSEVARHAGAPLAPEHCRPNLYVVVTPWPDPLVRAWAHNSPRMFGNGRPAEIERFLHSRRPARVWRNASLTSSRGMTLTPGAGEAVGEGREFDNFPVEHFADPTRLQWNSGLALNAVVLVIDAGRVQNLTAGQVADYAAMVGLTDVDLEADIGETPSILRLFDPPAPGAVAPLALTEWDQAYLKALYRTSSNSRLQRAEIAHRMMRAFELSPSGPPAP